MGHHIDGNGDFKSDKYPWCKPGFFALKFSDRKARVVIRHYAEITSDQELAADLITVCDKHSRDESIKAGN